MSTIELKKKLIQKIQSTDDNRLLEEAYRLLEIQLNENEKPFPLTKEMNMAIDESLEQIKNGEFLTQEEAEKEINEWFGK